MIFPCLFWFPVIVSYSLFCSAFLKHFIGHVPFWGCWFSAVYCHIRCFIQCSFKNRQNVNPTRKSVPHQLLCSLLSSDGTKSENKCAVFFFGLLNWAQHEIWCAVCAVLLSEPSQSFRNLLASQPVLLLLFITRIIARDQPIRGSAPHCSPAKLTLSASLFVLQVLSANGLLMTLVDFLSYSPLIRLHRLKLLDLHVSFLCLLFLL